jgi:hypothetical protein
MSMNSEERAFRSGPNPGTPPPAMQAYDLTRRNSGTGTNQTHSAVVEDSGPLLGLIEFSPHAGAGMDEGHSHGHSTSTSRRGDGADGLGGSISVFQRSTGFSGSISKGPFAEGSGSSPSKNGAPSAGCIVLPAGGGHHPNPLGDIPEPVAEGTDFVEVEQVALIGGHVTDCDPLGNSKHKEDPLSADASGEDQNDDDDVTTDPAPGRAKGKLGFAALAAKTRQTELDEED